MYFEKLIKEAIEEMGFVGIIVYGRQGAGKSVYAIKLAYKILGDWDKALNAVKFDAREILEFLSDKRKKILIWDDAGVFASKYLYFRDIHYVDLISSLVDTIRPKLACLVLTTPSPSRLLRVFREIDFYYVKIVKHRGQYRVAKIYGNYILPTGFRYTRLLAREIFNVLLPNDVYNKYLEKRQYYNEYVLAELKAYVKTWGK